VDTYLVTNYLKKLKQCKNKNYEREILMLDLLLPQLDENFLKLKLPKKEQQERGFLSDQEIAERLNGGGRTPFLSAEVQRFRRQLSCAHKFFSGGLTEKKKENMLYGYYHRTNKYNVLIKKLLEDNVDEVDYRKAITVDVPKVKPAKKGDKEDMARIKELEQQVAELMEYKVAYEALVVEVEGGFFISNEDHMTFETKVKELVQENAELKANRHTLELQLQEARKRCESLQHARQLEG